MSQTFRHPDILEIARTEGKVTVEGLAERFGVTVQTIRRDLTELAEAGKLERVHGGAILPSGVTNIGYDERRRLNAGAKAAIARTCAQDIPEGASVFLNIGTTTEAVARELLHHRNLMVVTNNMNVANILVANPEAEIILAGGVLRRADGGLVGPLTASVIEQFKVDLAVIGCSAMDTEGDLLDFDVQEVSVSQSIIRQARRTGHVVDHSKLHRAAPARIASLRQIDRVYTDHAFPPDLTRACADWGTEITICNPIQT
jgi:DeoR family transcriptional regulator, glycerol-3-phosphate regulon repressor